MNNRLVKQGDLLRFREQLITQEKSQATLEKYLRDLEHFCHFIADRSVTKEEVICYKQHLTQCYAPASVNSMLASLNQFLKFQGWHDCVVKALKIQHQSFRAEELELTREEYLRLLAAAKACGNQRLCLLMETICSTGIRVSELPFITVESAASGRATVSLKGKTRQVLIPKLLAIKLKEYTNQHAIRHSSIFITRSGMPMDRSNILHQMKSLCHQANVSCRKVFPHNLRHLFACLYYRAVKDLSRLADLLGHSNVNTTRIYTRVSGSEQQKQIDGLGLVV